MCERVWVIESRKDSNLRPMDYESDRGVVNPYRTVGYIVFLS